MWADRGVKLLVKPHPDKRELGKFLDGHFPILKLSEARASQCGNINTWPYFSVSLEHKEPLEVVLVATTSQYQRIQSQIPLVQGGLFRKERPFKCSPAEEESSEFTLHIKTSKTTFITPPFKVLAKGRFFAEKTKRAETEKKLSTALEKMKNQASAGPEDVQETLTDAFKAWEAADNAYLHTEKLVDLCRFAIYQNEPECGLDIATALEMRLKKKRPDNPEVFAKLFLCVGKIYRRLNSLKSAKEAYLGGLEQLSDNEELFATKYDLQNSLAQVLYQLTDDWEASLQLISEGLQDDRISPALRAKLLIANSRFERDRTKKIQSLMDSLDLTKESTTGYRLWKVRKYKATQTPDFDGLIDDVNQYLAQVEGNCFETCRLKWRLVVLHCCKRDRPQVLNGLADLIPRFANAHMYLELEKAMYLHDLVDPPLRKQFFEGWFPDLLPARLRRVREKLEHLAAMLAVA